ncbi:MAG: hypothetical protein O2954_09380 [bacterium]|nr:hypothetical protein [bacterium]
MKYLLLLLCALTVACGANTDRLKTEITTQEQKVAASQDAHRLSLDRLQELRDSLQINIAQNLKLGLNEEQARKVEQARINSQQTVAEAEAQALTIQQEYLALLKKQLQDTE